MAIVTNSNLPTLAARLAKVHVLVVDDDMEILQLVRGLLMKLGFHHITSATDGSEAIAMLKDKKLLREREIDLIITDWNMTPLSGIELMKFVRTSSESPNPYIPIIMLSGRGDWEDVEKARDAGFSEYLIKPFSAKALCDRILLCVENPRAFVSTATYKGPSRRRREAVNLPPGVEFDRRTRNSENNLPGKALKGKIGFDINMRQIFTKENVENAQEFIDDSAHRFREIAMRDVGALLHTLRNAQQTGNVEKHIGKLQRLAFSLKSHAGTFGYDLGTQVAKSLQNICDKPLDAPEQELIIIEKHIATLHLIFQKDVKGTGGPVGVELMNGLNALIRKYKEKPASPEASARQQSEA